MNLSKLKEFFSRYKELTIVLSLYSITVAIINPFGEFAIGDDIYFKHQIDAYNQGIFTKSALIDPTFIGQGVLGYIWSIFFGSSFISLRILTIIFSILSLIVLNSIFKLLKFESSKIVLGLSIFIFNPISLYLSLSFNTEIYFLFFSLLTLKYIFLFSESFQYKYLTYSLLFATLSFSVRQYGVIFLLLIIYILFKQKRINIKNSTTILITFIIMALIVSLPKYTNPEHIESKGILSLVSFENTFFKIRDFYELFPYLGLYLFPISLSIILKLSKRILFFLISLSIIFSIFYLNINIFNLGNILYIEGLSAKSYTELNLTLFNNIIFKFLVSFFCLLSFLTFIIYLIKIESKIQKNNFIYIFSLLTLLFYSIAILSTKEFDRYYINFFIFVTFFYLSIIKENIINKYALFISLLIFIVFSVIYNYEIYINTKLKWYQGNEIISKNTYKINEIFLSLNFTKYNTYVKRADFSGQESKVQIIKNDLKCYVQNRITGNENTLGQGIKKFSDKVNQYFKFQNPQIEDFGFNQTYKGKFRQSSILLSEVYYPDISYNLIGKKISIITFCNK